MSSRPSGQVGPCGAPVHEREKDLVTETKKGPHTFPSDKSFKILGYIFKPAGKIQDSLDGRMQSANKACWRDVKIYKSKDVPWRRKCRRMLDQACSVLCFGSERWSWSRATFTELQVGKVMRRLFRFNRGRRNVERIPYEDSEGGMDFLEEDETPFLL